MNSSFSFFFLFYEKKRKEKITYNIFSRMSNEKRNDEIEFLGESPKHGRAVIQCPPHLAPSSINFPNSQNLGLPRSNRVSGGNGADIMRSDGGHYSGAAVAAPVVAGPLIGRYVPVPAGRGRPEGVNAFVPNPFPFGRGGRDMHNARHMKAGKRGGRGHDGWRDFLGNEPGFDLRADSGSGSARRRPRSSRDFEGGNFPALHTGFGFPLPQVLGSGMNMGGGLPPYSNVPHLFAPGPDPSPEELAAMHPLARAAALTRLQRDFTPEDYDLLNALDAPPSSAAGAESEQSQLEEAMLVSRISAIPMIRMPNLSLKRCLSEGRGGSMGVKRGYQSIKESSGGFMASSEGALVVLDDTQSPNLLSPEHAAEGPFLGQRRQQKRKHMGGSFSSEGIIVFDDEDDDGDEVDIEECEDEVDDDEEEDDFLDVDVECATGQKKKRVGLSGKGLIVVDGEDSGGISVHAHKRKQVGSGTSDDACIENQSSAAKRKDGDQETPPNGPIINEACAVCLEDMPAGTLVKLLTCSHRFHDECISKWLVISKLKCPVCKFLAC